MSDTIRPLEPPSPIYRLAQVIAKEWMEDVGDADYDRAYTRIMRFLVETLTAYDGMRDQEIHRLNEMLREVLNTTVCRPTFIPCPPGGEKEGQ
jgi:hypothetical protein